MRGSSPDKGERRLVTAVLLLGVVSRPSQSPHGGKKGHSPKEGQRGGMRTHDPWQCLGAAPGSVLRGTV